MKKKKLHRMIFSFNRELKRIKRSIERFPQSEWKVEMVGIGASKKELMIDRDSSIYTRRDSDGNFFLETILSTVSRGSNSRP